MRKKPEGERDRVMSRMRAAVAVLNTGRFNERTKLIAFFSLQHPEFGPDRIVALANAIGRPDGR